MSDEIALTFGLRVRKTIGAGITNAFQADIETQRLTRDLTGTRKYANTQTIGTSYEAVTVGADLASRGYAFFRNLDPTNFVEIGGEVNSSFAGRIKLIAGDVAILPLSTDGLYARADTGAVELDYLILER